MEKQRFYKDMADVTVTFNDGEVKTYRISAGPTIGRYLAREAAASGVLTLFNATASWGIPMAGIRDWEIAYTGRRTGARDRTDRRGAG